MSSENGTVGEKVVHVSDINQELNNLNIEDIIDRVHDVEDGTDVYAGREDKEDNASPGNLKICAVLELKEKLITKKLPMTANKNALIKHLLGLEAVADSVRQTKPHKPNLTEHDLRRHTVTELKEML